MCLGTVVVTRLASPSVEVRDVTSISFADSAALVTTLFGEEQRFAGVSIQQIDLRKGVTISLVEEAIQ